jgi:hypothetical protein
MVRGISGIRYLIPLASCIRDGAGREEHIFCASIIERASESGFLLKSKKWHWSCKHESFSLVYFSIFFIPCLLFFFPLVLHEGCGGRGEHTTNIPLYIYDSGFRYFCLYAALKFFIFFLFFTWSK